MIALDEFGRLVEAAAGPGDRLVLTGPARGPVVPPVPPAPRDRSPKWPGFLRRFLRRRGTARRSGRGSSGGSSGAAGPLAEVAGVPPAVPPAPRDRSPKWPGFLRRFLRVHPACGGCGRRAETGHHVEPFHLRPDRELDPANVAAVCVPCHFVLCHAGDWRLVVPGCREVLAAHLPLVRAAKAAV